MKQIRLVLITLALAAGPNWLYAAHQTDTTTNKEDQQAPPSQKSYIDILADKLSIRPTTLKTGLGITGVAAAIPALYYGLPYAQDWFYSPPSADKIAQIKQEIEKYTKEHDYWQDLLKRAYDNWENLKRAESDSTLSFELTPLNSNAKEAFDIWDALNEHNKIGWWSDKAHKASLNRQLLSPYQQLMTYYLPYFTQPSLETMILGTILTGIISSELYNRSIKKDQKQDNLPDNPITDVVK